MAYYLISQARESAFQKVRNYLRLAAQKRKAHYDDSVRAKQFAIGDHVWYFYLQKFTEHSQAWSFLYVGPYTFLTKLSDLKYVIQKSLKDQTLVEQVDKLKRCVPIDASINSVLNKTMFLRFVRR